MRRAMDFLDRLLGHDAWTTGLILDRCRELTDAELDRPFDIGLRSIGATLEHIVFNMEAWSALMAGEATPSADDGPSDRSPAALRARLDRAAARLARVAHDVVARGAWDERWLDVMDDPPAEKTFGGAIAHVITHSMHHRAQVLHMLRQVGLRDLPEGGDVLTWESQRETA